MNTRAPSLLCRLGLCCAPLLATTALANPPVTLAVNAPRPTTAVALKEAPRLPDAAALTRAAARFAPTALQADLTDLPESERAALARVLQAARLMDAIYLRQVSPENPQLLVDLARDGSALGRARLQALLLNGGPWSRLDHNAAFLPGVGEKPAAAGFYPPGATKPEIDAWLATLPAAERERALGFYTVIRRGPDGRLSSVPYSIEYQGELGRAAALLRDAAGLSREPSLQAFLSARAAAFVSNDYLKSDVLWMELDSRIEPTIGPYETYEDEWFGAKAAFEAFITVRDEAETKRLQRYSAHLQDIEDHLPIDPALRNPKLGAMAPIRVVNSIYCSGEANRAVQTAAYNLPNDERITREKGTKRVMLKNVQEAKFRAVLVPIARVALGAADQKKLSFDAFFTHILMHELMHGLGPHQVALPGGGKSTPRAELQSDYSAIEEAKADISGLFALQHLMDKGVVDKGMEETLYVTFLASAFRTLRFGLSEAHGKGMALQLNYLLDQGAVQVGKDGTFAVVADKFKAAVVGLTRELLTLEARGDRKGAQERMGRLGVVRPEVQRVIDRLGAVPVDIAPRFPTAERLLAQGR